MHKSRMASVSAIVGIVALSVPALGSLSVSSARPTSVHFATLRKQFPALPSTDTVRAWGANNHGQLGDGTTNPNVSPVAVVGLSGAASISCGESYCLALLTDGTVKAWGSNSSGQLGDNSTTDSHVPVSVSGLSGVVGVAASRGGSHSLALLRNRTVKAWGSNSSGQLGDNSTTNSDVPVSVSGLTGVVTVAAGANQSLALLRNGTVKAWGSNGSGQLGDHATTGSDVPVSVSGLTGVTAVCAGTGFSVALLHNGTVKTWGSNSFGRLGNGSAVRSLLPVTVTGLTEVRAIACGTGHTLALLRNGTVKAWGSNGSGQLGDDSTTNSDVPVSVSGLTGVVAVAAGGDDSLARLYNGTVKAWGSNSSGQLGEGIGQEPDLGIGAFASVPTTAEASGVLGIAAGDTEGLAIEASYQGAPQPTFPIRATFYYPWNPEHWDTGNLGTAIVSQYTPTLGHYSAADPTVVTTQISDMIYAGINVAIYSWWGPNQRSLYEWDTEMDSRFQSFLDATGDKPLKWAIYYECERHEYGLGAAGCTGPSAEPVIASDLAYIKERYAGNPNYLKVNGKPVIFVYNAFTDPNNPCSAPENWAAANTSEGFYLVLKVFAGYQSCADQPDSWHEYAPAFAEEDILGYSFFISPGFWSAADATPRLARDLATWTQNIQDMISSKEPWQLIETYNEWGEGTAVESATGTLPNGWQSPSGHGLFIDELHQALVDPSATSTSVPACLPLFRALAVGQGRSIG